MVVNGCAHFCPVLRFGRNRQTMFAAFLGILVELPGRTSRINPRRLALCVAKGVQSCKLGTCPTFTNDQLQFSGFAGKKCANVTSNESHTFGGVRFLKRSSGLT